MSSHERMTIAYLQRENDSLREYIKKLEKKIIRLKKLLKEKHNDSQAAV